MAKIVRRSLNSHFLLQRMFFNFERFVFRYVLGNSESKATKRNNKKVTLHAYNTTQNVKVEGAGYLILVEDFLEPLLSQKSKEFEAEVEDVNNDIIEKFGQPNHKLKNFGTWKDRMNKNFSCSVTCEGVYADVQLALLGEEEKREDMEKVFELVQQYNDFKRKKLRNFRFNPEKGTTHYGK